MKEKFFINLPGGIGDLIIALPILEALKLRVDDFYNLVVYTNYPELLGHFLPELEIVEHSKFLTDRLAMPFWLGVTDVPIWKFQESEVRLPNPVADLLETWSSHLPVWGPLIDGWPDSCNLIGQKAVSEGLHRSNLCAYLLGLQIHPYWYKHADPKIKGDFITVHDGFNTTTDIPKDFSVKNWPLHHWETFTSMFRAQYPSLRVLQLGSNRSRLIPGAEHQLVGQISFVDSLQYLAQAVCHVDGDSGLVHARHMFDNPSVVLFGPTLATYFGYPENENLVSPTCHPCWWLKGDQWLNQCMFGAQGPSPCMQSIPAEIVLSHVDKLLGVHKTDEKACKTKSKSSE